MRYLALPIFLFTYALLLITAPVGANESPRASLQLSPITRTQAPARMIDASAARSTEIGSEPQSTRASASQVIKTAGRHAPVKSIFAKLRFN
jgi:hypothetical protein